MTAGANALAGMAGYWSLEQVNGRELDGRSNLCAVGSVFWELLALRPRRVGLGLDIMVQAIFQTILRPSQYRQGFPADLEAVAMRLLAL